MKATVWGVSAMALAVLTACGRNEAPKSSQSSDAQKLEQAAKDLEAAGKKLETAANGTIKDVGTAMNDMMNAIGSAATAASAASGGYEPVDFRVLSELLPEQLSDFEKGDHSGERNSGFGIAVSEVRQSFFSSDKKKHVRFEIIDPGTLSGPVSMAHAWMSVEIDRQSSEGYERTSIHNGRKLYEKWTQAAQKGEVTMVVGQRFIVEVEGTGVAMTELKALLEKLDLKKLDSLKNEGKKG